jgi:hypothetical protein
MWNTKASISTTGASLSSSVPSATKQDDWNSTGAGQHTALPGSSAPSPFSSDTSRYTAPFVYDQQSHWITNAAASPIPQPGSPSNKSSIPDDLRPMKPEPRVANGSSTQRQDSNAARAPAAAQPQSGLGTRFRGEPDPSGSDATQKVLYSITGRVIDINNIPISHVVLSVNGTYGAATDAAGYYTVTNLVSAIYVLTATKSVYKFSPAWRTVDVPMSAKEQDFTVVPDLGFRPQRDGYNFNNPGQATPDCQAFRRSFSGLDIQCSHDQPQSQFLTLFDRYKFSFRSGICTGMAATSLAYYVGLLAAPQPSPTNKLTLDQAWSDIATLHGRQYSKAVLDLRILNLSAWKTTDANVISQRVDEIYSQLRSAIQPGNPDPVVLDLVSRPGCDASGHTVTPYRLDEADPFHPKVYIYENFSPGDSSKFIQFDFSSPEHRFNYWKWDSDSCGALIAIPISAFTSPKDKVPSIYLGRLSLGP